MLSITLMIIALVVYAVAMALIYVVVAIVGVMVLTRRISALPHPATEPAEKEEVVA